MVTTDTSDQADQTRGNLRTNTERNANATLADAANVTVTDEVQDGEILITSTPIDDQAATDDVSAIDQSTDQVA